MLTTRFASSMPQAFADDVAGFDYFATDFHYMNVAGEIRRQLSEQRGFVLLNGPPAPDGKLLERYLDGSNAADESDAVRFRANLVRCHEGWTFGDVIIAYSRELGLSPDAGAWSILSQVMQESRKGLVRVLILDNADALDDEGFDELRRFTRVDDPYILPVVLLAGPGLADRLDAELRASLPAIVGSLQLQHLMPAEVGPFIRYQIEPIGNSHNGAFTPGAVATIAEAAEGDPRVVNRLARQHLEIFAGPRGPATAVEPETEAEDAPLPTELAPLPEEAPPEAEPPPEPAFAPAPSERDFAPTSSPAAPVETVTLLPRPPRQSAERLARNLTIGAGLLFVGAYGIALLYSLVPEGSSGGSPPKATATLPAMTTGAPAAPAPAQTADRSSVQQAAPEKSAAPAEPPQPTASKDAAPSLGAAARQAASIEPSAAAQTAPPAQPVAPPAQPSPPPEQVARAEPAPPPPPPPSATRAEPAAPPQSAAAASPAPVARSELQPAPRSAAAADPPSASEATALIERGDRLLAAGDIASAREFFERAVESGDAAASYGMGKSYDPLFLRQVSMRGVAADPAKAAGWYRRAASAGNAEAAKRLAQLLAKYPPGTGGEGSSR